MEPAGRRIDRSGGLSQCVRFMAESASDTPEAPRTLVFRLACWGCALVAFGEVMTAAVALAVRMEKGRELRVVEREVIREAPAPVRPVPPVVPPAAGEPSVVARPPVSPPVAQETPPVTRETPPFVPPPAVAPAPPAPTPLATPPIADPVVEKLVTEARKFRVAEDMAHAIVKLEEASAKSPDEPNVEFELGQVHEAMGVFDTASQHYQKVFQMGVGRAGVLYEMAAAKLRDGFSQNEDLRGKLSLGRVRIFKDMNFSGGERVVVTIPVQAAPGTKVSPDDFSVTVRFFDTLRGKEIAPASETTCRTDYQWVSGAIDWAGGEELLRVTYILPKQEVAQTHLFGERAYYGQVVELTYKNDLIDLQAWPRDLAAKTQQPQLRAPAQQQQADDLPPEFLNQDTLPPDFNPGAPLLPAKPNR